MAAPIRLRPPAVGTAYSADHPGRGAPTSRTRPRLGYTSEPGYTRATFVPSPRSSFGFKLHWDDIVQINPVLEQPKLIFYSLAQPIIRWGHRRYVRPLAGGLDAGPGGVPTGGQPYGMRAGPRFFGRWAYIGIQMAQFRDRGKTAGVQGRPWTYKYPSWQSGPTAQRTIDIGAITYAWQRPQGGPAPAVDPTGALSGRISYDDPISQQAFNVSGKLAIPSRVILSGGSSSPAIGR